MCNNNTTIKTGRDGIIQFKIDLIFIMCPLGRTKSKGRLLSLQKIYKAGKNCKDLGGLIWLIIEKCVVLFLDLLQFVQK